MTFWRNVQFGGSSSKCQTSLTWIRIKSVRVHVVQRVMKDFTAETSTGSSSARAAEGRLGIPEPSIRSILHGILDLYPYKIQAFHQFLPADIGAKQNFATWALAQMECNPQWLLNAMWSNEPHFSLHGDVNKHHMSTSWAPQSATAFSWCDCLVLFYWIFSSGAFLIWRTLTFILLENLYCPYRTVSYAFAWIRCACISGKNCITCCHHHAR